MVLTVTCLLPSHSLGQHFEPQMERIIWWLLLDLDLKAGNVTRSPRIICLTSYSGPSLPDVLVFFAGTAARAQKADQGRSENRPLWQAVQRQDLARPGGAFGAGGSGLCLLDLRPYLRKALLAQKSSNVSLT